MKEFEITLRIDAAEIMEPNCIMKKLKEFEKKCHSEAYIVEIKEVLKTSNMVCDMFEGDGSCNVDVLFSADYIQINRGEFFTMKLLKIEDKKYKFKDEIKIVMANIVGDYKEGDLVPLVAVKVFHDGEIIKIAADVMTTDTIRRIYAIKVQGTNPPKIIESLIKKKLHDLNHFLEKNPKLPFPEIKPKATRFLLNEKIDYESCVIVFPLEAGWLSYYEFNSFEEAEKHFKIFEKEDRGRTKYEIILQRLVAINNLLEIWEKDLFI